MQSSKDIVANLQEAIASNDDTNTSRARDILNSHIRTQLSVRNAKSPATVASLYSALMKSPDVWDRLPDVEDAKEAFQPQTDVAPGFSLVSCCMNRNDHLARTLPTWLSHPEIDEVVVVDWSSEIPVAITLEQAGIQDPRLRIVRVEDEGAWILSHAYNVGFRATTRDKIVKVDSDIILDTAFFEKNTMGVGKLTAGNWRNASAGQSHVNGFFVTGRADLLGVNGFNERIVTYGWDDDDLYTRLEEAGVERVDVDPSTINHIDHSDIRRVARPRCKPVTGWDEIQTYPQFWIALNREFTASSAPWGVSYPMAGFQVLSATDGNVRLRRTHPFGVDTNLIGTRSERALAAYVAIQDIFPGFVVTTSPETVDFALMTRSLKDALVIIGSQTPEPQDQSEPAAAAIGDLGRKPKLIVDAQHGLGNRMRAIASAAAFAKVHDRELVIRWVRDEHCDCRFASLFDYDGPVEETSDNEPENAQHVDLMNKAFRDSFESKSLVHTSRDIVIQSAYRFTFGKPYGPLEKSFLRDLKPSAEVQDLIDSVRSPNDIAVHVRMNGGAGTDPHGDVPGGWSKTEDEISRRARSRSHYGFFFKRLDELLESGEYSTIFLASDNSESYDAFAAKYHDRVTSLKRSVYDRSEMQLKYALADVILLSRAPLLLGSNWSSFTEIAHSMSEKQRLEISGQHF